MGEKKNLKPIDVNKLKDLLETIARDYNVNPFRLVVGFSEDMEEIHCYEIDGIETKVDRFIGLFDGYN